MKRFSFGNLKEEVPQSKAQISSPHQILIDSLKNAITNNSSLILNANKEDVKISKKEIKIKKLLDVIDRYKETNEVSEIQGKQMIVYKGDPYLTLHLCMQAITQKFQVMLLHDDFMLGVNKVLVAIVNNTLKELNISNFIEEKNHYTVSDIKNSMASYDHIAVIGDSDIYQILEKDFNNIKYFSYNNIALYCNSSELEKLQEAIYIYANENQYELEVMCNDSIQEAIKTINSDTYKNTAILLTARKEDKDLFINEVKNKDIYINDNPFKEELGRVYNYLG